MHKLIPNRSGYYNRLKCILFLKIEYFKIYWMGYSQNAYFWKVVSHVGKEITVCIFILNYYHLWTFAEKKTRCYLFSLLNYNNSLSKICISDYCISRVQIVLKCDVTRNEHSMSDCNL